MIESFQELIVWQKAMNVVTMTYALAASLPQYERMGLASQIRRAAVSIPSNIAEGKKRGSRKDFTQFLRIANGSAAELETQLILASRLHGIDTADTRAVLNEVQRMLNTMVRRLA